MVADLAMVYGCAPAFGLKLSQALQSDACAALHHQIPRSASSASPCCGCRIPASQSARSTGVEAPGHPRSSSVATHCQRKNLDDSRSGRVYERCEGLGLPVSSIPATRSGRADAELLPAQFSSAPLRSPAFARAVFLSLMLRRRDGCLLPARCHAAACGRDLPGADRPASTHGATVRARGQAHDKGALDLSAPLLLRHDRAVIRRSFLNLVRQVGVEPGRDGQRLPGRYGLLRVPSRWSSGWPDLPIADREMILGGNPARPPQGLNARAPGRRHLSEGERDGKEEGCQETGLQPAARRNMGIFFTR